MESSDGSANAQPQVTLRWLFVVVTAFAVIFGCVRFAQGVLEVPNDAYAMWAAGDVLIAYMKDHDCDWPSSWETLADHHASSGGGTTMIGPFAEMRARIRIDFSFDSKVVLESIETTDVAPDFRVVTLKDGGNTHWTGMEPNQRVFDFLKAHKIVTAFEDLTSLQAVGQNHGSMSRTQ